jgi:hypothetical protein
MLGFNGGLMGIRRTPTLGAATGLWLQNEQSVARRAGVWPQKADTVSSLLLLYEETNTPTVVKDYSAANNTMTRTGGGHISTYLAKQGISSYYVNESNAKLKGSNSVTFSGDFMWQTWWYPEYYQAGYKAILGVEGSSSWQLFVNDDGNKPLFFLQHRPGFNMILDGSSGGAITLNQWNHVALTREGTDLRMWLNGALRASTTYSATITGVPVANEWFTGTPYLGLLDVTQMVNGVAVYTSTFTPSSEPYA